ncbi:MAG: hypothetical protein LBP59_10690 [Planctomycetaceae bacterium]|jgi:hypothetical protein|nr:hypothetical protein [Planctomycetaceae bacterium]
MNEQIINQCKSDIQTCTESLKDYERELSEIRSFIRVLEHKRWELEWNVQVLDWINSVADGKYNLTPTDPRLLEFYCLLYHKYCNDYEFISCRCEDDDVSHDVKNELQSVKRHELFNSIQDHCDGDVFDEINNMLDHCCVADPLTMRTVSKFPDIVELAFADN